MTTSPRVAPTEVAHVRNVLSAWCDVESFAATVESFKRRVPDVQFFNSELKFLREAWVDGKLAQAIKAEAIRIPKSDPPDIELRVSGHIQPFEVVEAMVKGYRRHDEYHNREDNPSLTSAQCMSLVTEQEALELIRTLCEKKATKSYAANTGLIVYVNMWFFERLADDALRQVMQSALQRFSSVWLLWGSSPARKIEGK